LLDEIYVYTNIEPFTDRLVTYAFKDIENATADQYHCKALALDCLNNMAQNGKYFNKGIHLLIEYSISISFDKNPEIW
jgi:hypothetical protein